MQQPFDDIFLFPVCMLTLLPVCMVLWRHKFWCDSSAFSSLYWRRKTNPSWSNSGGWNGKKWCSLREGVERGKIVKGLQHGVRSCDGSGGKRKSNSRVSASRRAAAAAADAAKAPPEGAEIHWVVSPQGRWWPSDRGSSGGNGSTREGPLTQMREAFSKRHHTEQEIIEMLGDCECARVGLCRGRLAFVKA